MGTRIKIDENTTVEAVNVDDAPAGHPSKELGQLIQNLLNTEGMCHHSAAAGLTHLAQQLYREQEFDALHTLLKLLFTQVSMEMLKHIDSTPPQVDTAMGFLESYFNFKGDWNRMAEFMEQMYVETHRGKEGFLQTLFKGFDKALATMLSRRRHTALLN